jgi:hypothetical protein
MLRFKNCCTHVVQFFSFPLTPDQLVWKVWASVIISFAGRLCEVRTLQWDNITRLVDENGNARYSVSYTRSKSTGPIQESDAYIIGSDEVNYIDQYVSFFPPKQRTGRFWRYIEYSKDRSNYFGTLKVIGEHTLANFGKLAAQKLGLANSDSYTSHCFRRTAITMASNAGATTTQIKSISGHKSDQCVQRYIDRSEPNKMNSASMLCIDEDTLPKAKKTTFEDKETISVSHHYHINAANVSIVNGTMNTTTLQHEQIEIMKDASTNKSNFSASQEPATIIPVRHEVPEHISEQKDESIPKTQYKKKQTTSEYKTRSKK